MPSSSWGLARAALLLGSLTACSGSYEATVRNDLIVAQAHRPFSQRASQPTGSGRASSAKKEAGLASYVRLALEKNPEVQASFERWQASVYRISRARRLPEPSISFGYFVQSIETRVGPQQARISLKQAFPWPTQLTAGADSASARARAMQRRFEARALSVTQRVASAYWKLWQIRTTRAIHQEHLDVVRSLSKSARARISTGQAMLADLQQIDLAAARVEDNIRGMDEAEQAAKARLQATIGVGADFAVPTQDPPPPASLPKESASELFSAAQTHPSIESLGLLAQASEATAKSEGAKRMPSFTVGADWIITGETPNSSIQDNGKDAFIVGAGIRLPLWQSSYSDSVQAAEAESRALRADQRSIALRLRAELSSTLARLRDTIRRVSLYRSTLVPQAQTAYESVLGAYTVGRGSVAQALLSQRDLLELRIELEKARAQYAQTWARLSELVGQELTPRGQEDSLREGKTHEQ